MNDVDQTSTWDSSPHVLRIGSAEDNDVVVDDTFVSRYHAELRRSASGWNVRDLGSSNGTFLSGVQVLSAVAQLGDTLRIGHTELALDADEPRWLSSHTAKDAEVLNLPDDLPAADTAAANTASATTDASPVAVDRPVPDSAPIHRIRIYGSTDVVGWSPLSAHRGGELLLFPGRWEYVQSRGSLRASGPVQEISGVKKDWAGNVTIALTPKNDTKRWLRHIASRDASPSPSAIEDMIDDARRAGAGDPEQTVSPDGRWLWDGAQWVPNQPDAMQGTVPSTGAATTPAEPGDEQKLTPEPTVSPDGRWRWDGAQWVPNQTAPSTQPDSSQGLGTPDDSSGDGGSEAGGEGKSAGLSLKVGAAALAIIGLMGVIANSVEGNDADGSTSTALDNQTTGDASATNDTDADSEVEWAYMNGVWNGAPAATRTAVCQDFRRLGPASFYEQKYLAYNPQPVHDDGRILSEGAHTRFHSQVCTRY